MERLMESSDSDASSRPVRDASCCAQSRWVQQAVRIWFCYCYPLCFLAASLLRPATSVSAIYSLIAFLVLFLPACRVRACEASSWRRLHLVLGILTLSLLIVAGVMLALCRHSSLEEEALVAGKLMFFGIAWDLIKGMHYASVAGSRAMGWCESMVTVKDAGWTGFSQVSLTVRFSFALPAFTSICSLSFLPEISIPLCDCLYTDIVGCREPVRSARRAAAGQFSLRFRVAENAALLTVSVPVLPFELPERVSRLLGLEVTPLMALQQMASFLLLELILWPAFPAHEATKKSLQVPRGVSEELRRMEAPSPSANGKE
ncbi:Pfdn6, partial [Symbiodinium necroappetens]